MKKLLKKFLANIKGSAFIEQLMTYVAVAAIGIAVVGVTTKTINDAAAGSPYQSELGTTGGGNEGGNENSSTNYELSFTLDLYTTTFEIGFDEGTTWGEMLQREDLPVEFYLTRNCVWCRYEGKEFELTKTEDDYEGMGYGIWPDEQVEDITYIHFDYGDAHLDYDSVAYIQRGSTTYVLKFNSGATWNNIGTYYFGYPIFLIENASDYGAEDCYKIFINGNDWTGDYITNANPEDEIIPGQTYHVTNIFY